jgi:hypothetical protein
MYQSNFDVSQLGLFGLRYFQIQLFYQEDLHQSPGYSYIPPYSLQLSQSQAFFFTMRVYFEFFTDLVPCCLQEIDVFLISCKDQFLKELQGAMLIKQN